MVACQMSQPLLENFWKLNSVNCQSGNGNWTRTPEMTRKVSVCRNTNSLTILDSSDLEVYRTSNFLLWDHNKRTDNKWKMRRRTPQDSSSYFGTTNLWVLQKSITRTLFEWIFFLSWWYIVLNLLCTHTDCVYRFFFPNSWFHNSY